MAVGARSEQLVDRGLGPAWVTQVVVAGGGIGGLVLANALQRHGIDFEVYEKTKEYRPFGGPIQVQSNALAALEAINKEMCEEIMAAGTTTGNRVNGLKDGVTNRWYCQFDTGAPAQKRGLPLTRVVDRPDLQRILLKYMDTSRLHNGVEVMDYKEKGNALEVTLSTGEKVDADVLVRTREPSKYAAYGWVPVLLSSCALSSCWQ